ncbi:MAG: phosphoglucosamine mutase [Gammaproteobacteria bacterium]|nr:phosphoglucosamine mutase [Gammaproteobacteria bacterium]
MAEKHYFGTDGIRGEVGSRLINAEFVLKLGWATGKVLAKSDEAKVVVGCDTRISSKLLQSVLLAGFASAGVDVFLLGVIPTPAVAYLTHSLRAQAGIMISASHNPYYDNGFKFFDENGMKLSNELELAIEAQLKQSMRTAHSDSIGKITRINDASGRYVEFCKSTFPTQLSLKGLKVVVDCANGAGFSVAPSIFYELGVEVIPLATKPDGYNINKNCGATDVKSLQAAVLEHTADLGIALDGDGDRLMMVDHLGEIVDGDQILCLLAKDNSTGMGSRQGIVGTVMSNLGLEQALIADGISFTRTAVGDRYVLEELIERGWSLGGESSGHIVNLDFTTTGDGIITALQVLRVMKMANKNLHQLKQAMTKRPQVLINVPVKATVNLMDYPEINAAIKVVEKKLAGRGRVLVRPSGTQPYVRVMVEGNDMSEVQQVAEQLVAVTEAELN